MSAPPDGTTGIRVVYPDVVYGTTLPLTLRVAEPSRTYSFAWKNFTTTGTMPSAGAGSELSIVSSIESWLAGESTDLTPPLLESTQPAQAPRTMIIAIRGTIMVSYPTSFPVPRQRTCTTRLH